MNGHAPSLHPLKAGEILDRAFRLYRAHFWLFIGIASIVLVPMLILEIVSLVLSIDVQFVSSLQSFLMGYLVYGAMIWAAARTYLGQSVSLNESYRQAGRYFRPIFGAYFRQGLAYLPLIIFLVVGGAFAGSGAERGVGIMILVIFGLVIFIPFISFLSTRWAVSIPAIVIEDLTGVRGLERSWFLTLKDFWRIFLVLLASTLLSYFVVTLPSTLIAYVMTQFGFISVVGPLLAAILSQLGTIITTPLTLIILVILYYDLRVRREGYDLQLEMELDTVDQQPDLSPKEDLPDAE